MAIVSINGAKHNVANLCGWAGEELARAAFDPWKEEFAPLSGRLRSSVRLDGRRMMLWELVRKVLGKDTPNYAQQVGDCVSFGMKNGGEYLQCSEIAMGDRQTFKYLFAPYLWGCGRIFVGKNQLGRQDGSLGVWQAKAVLEYGFIPADAQGVPQYSGTVARQWGNAPGPGAEFVKLGKDHIVQSAALVRTWEEALLAVVNGNPVTIASDVGFDMQARSDGFHRDSDTWNHQMCIIGMDDGGDGVEPHACILNSWGDAHGVVKDFRTGEAWPVGTLRVRKSAINRILSQGDSYAIGGIKGFEEQVIELERRLFDPW